MTGLLDSATLEIPCTCGRKTKKTIGWVKSNSQLRCTCGTLIKLDASQFRNEMRKVDGAIGDLQRQLAKFGR